MDKAEPARERGSVLRQAGWELPTPLPASGRGGPGPVQKAAVHSSSGREKGRAVGLLLLLEPRSGQLILENCVWIIVLVAPKGDSHRPGNGKCF